MPPESKRKLHLEKARASKRVRAVSADETVSHPPVTSSDDPLTSTSGEQTETGYESYNEADSMQLHAKEWVESLNRDDLLSLSILLWYLLVGILALGLLKLLK